MAQLVLGLAGAAVLGPAGFGLMTANTGWMIGSTIGAFIGGNKGQNTQGPRLNDLTVQSSAYGQFVPVVYGAYKVNGNVIFSTDKREVATTNRVGGKGGPRSSQTTYTYNVDMAVALCDNTIAGVRKVWNDGKLIFDESPGASIESMLASELRARAVRVYLGSETQLPDPSIEAERGVGNVPGYRGTAYIVFEQLDCPNGQIPQLSFEVLQSVTTGPVALLGSLQTLPTSMGGLTSGIQPITYVSETSLPTAIFTQLVNAGGSGWRYKMDDLGSNYVAGAASGEQTGIRYQNSGIDGHMDEPLQAVQEITIATVTTGFLRIFNSLGNDVGPALDLRVPNVADGAVRVGKVGAHFVTLQSRTDLANTVAVSLYDWPGLGLIATRYLPYLTSTLWLTTSHVWVVYVVAAVRRLEVLRLSDLSVVSNVALAFELGPGGNSANFAPLENGNLGAVSLSNSGNLLVLWELSEAGAQTETGRHASATTYPTARDAVMDSSGAIGINGTNVYAVSVVYTTGNTYTVQSVVYRFVTLDAVPASLSAVIADICARSGVTTQVDVSDVTDQIIGYALTNLAPARQNIDPLLSAYFIDPTKQDARVRFRPRATLPVVATIAFGELAAAPDIGGGDDPLPLARTIEDSLARSYAVNYLNQADDYQVGTEVARRIVTNSINDQSQQLAVVLTANRAATIASALLFNDWAERNKRTAKLTREYAHLDAGDVVSIEFPPGTFSPYRITRAGDDGTTCDLELVDFDGPIYTVTQLGSATTTGQVVAPAASPSRVRLLDIPILRDADNDAGLYAAVGAYTDNWPGAVLYAGTQDSTLEPRASFNGASVIGLTDNILVDWTGSIMDEASTVDVNLAAGELFNTTRENVFSQRANIAVLGQEIIGFTRATLLTGNTYRLSGLLRGMRGTERFRGTHRQGDLFTLLDFGHIGRVSYDVAEIGEERRFKAVTLGQNVNDGTSTPFINTAEGLKPFSPVNLRKNLTSGGNTFFTWDRRTRLSENWLTGVFPLGEESERYQVELRDLSNVLLNSGEVTTAQWDFPSGPTNLTSRQFTVWQMSAIYGRGTPITLTV